MMDKFTLADELARVFGGAGRGGFATWGGGSTSNSGSTSSMYGTAVSDSAYGRVSVVMQGYVIGSNDGNNVIDMDTTVEVHEGDKVLITIVDGHPTVTGVVGWGDSVAERANELSQAADAADAKAQTAQESADQLRKDTDAAFENAKTEANAKFDGIDKEIAAFKSDAAATYSTKTETDEKTGAITKTLEADYLKKEDASTTYSTKTETKESVDGLASTVSATYETKADAAATYSTKTELSQTSDTLSASISKTLTDANSHTDSAVASEAAARDTAISASAEGIRTEVAGKYLLSDDAAATYSTKTDLTQTEDTLKASISQTLTDANSHADDAVASEATARDAAISASADSIKTEVSSTYVRGDGTGTDTVTSTVKQNSTSIETMFTSGVGKDVKDTADSAKSTADDLSTLIRSDSTGITVGKSTDSGKTYSGNRTHMGTSSFEILNSAGTVLSRFTDKLIELGKNSTEAVIQLVNGQASIAFGGISRGILNGATSGLIVQSTSHPLQILGHSDGNSEVEIALTTSSGNGEICLSNSNINITLAGGGSITSININAGKLSNLNGIISRYAVPVYRLYNPNGGGHIHTANADERNNLLSAGWKDDGISFYGLSV